MSLFSSCPSLLERGRKGKGGGGTRDLTKEFVIQDLVSYFTYKLNWVGRNAPQLKIRLGSQARGSTYIWRFILEAYYRLGLNKGNTVLFLFSRCSRPNRPLSVKRCVHFKRHDGKSASWNYLKCTVRSRT